jgi:hypothetical protein
MSWAPPPMPLRLEASLSNYNDMDLNSINSFVEGSNIPPTDVALIRKFPSFLDQFRARNRNPSERSIQRLAILQRRYNALNDPDRHRSPRHYGAMRSRSPSERKSYYGAMRSRSPSERKSYYGAMRSRSPSERKSYYGAMRRHKAYKW